MLKAQPEPDKWGGNGDGESEFHGVEGRLGAEGRSVAVVYGGEAGKGRCGQAAGRAV